MTTTASRGGLVDAHGRPVRLGRAIGRGGEGHVYEVVGVSDCVAKLYHAAADAEQSAKLAAMVRGATPALTEIAAWPTTTLHARGGADAPVVGLVMPRAHGAPVHRLYSPVARKTEFPHVDWKRLVIVAHNVAAAMARLHEAGHVVGDVNQGNVLVEPGGRVRLIDCDSFQIRDANAPGGARWFPCEVGVAHFTPPELQGASFAGITRTPNHDAFGLAVLVFHLLFMGRHPFAGRYAGTGEMPIEQAITEFRFAFGRNAGAVQMARPPHALALEGASPGVADLFERAFGRDGVREGGRPTAGDWETALRTLAGETVRCAAAPAHRYPRTLGGCPWCAIASAGGPDFFGETTVGRRAVAGFSAAVAWLAILAVPEPDAHAVMPAGPTTAPAPTHPVTRWQRVAWQGQAPVGIAAALALFDGSTGAVLRFPSLAVGVGLLGLFAGLRRGSGLAGAYTRRCRELDTARARLGGVEARWKRELGLARRRFDAERDQLEVLRSEYQRVEPVGPQGLEARRREHQLRQYLDGHVIATSRVPGVGFRRATTLAAHGITTAADVTYAAVIAVPGFRKKPAHDLVAWRRSLEKTFQFDPSKANDVGELAALETRFARRREEIERALVAGPVALRQLGSVATELRANLVRELHAQQGAVAAATANVVAITGRGIRDRLGVLAWSAAAIIALVGSNALSDRLDVPPPAADAAGPPVDVRSYFVQHPPVPAPPAASPPSDRSRIVRRACGGESYCEFQVEKVAAAVPGALSARYPEELKDLPFGGNGRVVVQFVVDPSGKADMRTWTVLESTHDLFTRAARDAVSRGRFYPAEIGGKPVRQLVQLPFTFTLSR